IIGGGVGGSAILNTLMETDYLHVYGVVDLNPNASAIKTAASRGIPTAEDYAKFDKQQVDIVFNVTGSDQLYQELKDYYLEKTVVIPGSLANVFVRLLEEKEHFITQLSKDSHRE